MRKILLGLGCSVLALVLFGCGSGGAGDSGPYYFTVEIEKRNCRSDCTWTARREVVAKVYVNEEPEIIFNVPNTFLSTNEGISGKINIYMTNPFSHKIGWDHMAYSSKFSRGELDPRQKKQLSFVHGLYITGGGEKRIDVDIYPIVAAGAKRPNYFVVLINFTRNN